jgi:serine/threonine-protein kinase
MKRIDRPPDSIARGIQSSSDGEASGVSRVNELVAQVLASASKLRARDRERFLDGVGEVAPDVRDEVQELLSAQEKGRSGPPTVTQVLDENATLVSGRARAPESPGKLSGRRVGAYRLVREIGRGGNGTVYLAARDDDQFRKDVAVKLVHPGTDSGDIIRRFRQERQILASLDHPHIAKLHDGGTTDDGLPYFVMEYVEGDPIDRFCDRGAYPVEKRLELFRQVCSAVHFAHQNLVVHRDLKPANILVTGDGDIKLLDFGIAKVLKPDTDAASSEATRVDARAMTPDYASPEQVTGAPITTASDVYSLGVVLYELLAGCRPYRIQQAELAEIVRVLCHDEPRPPSARVREREDAEAAALRRSASPERLRRRLQGDLDNVVRMAMQKDPLRRYASVAELSEDLRRHLDGLPVKARPDTFAYRSAKFVRRHWAAAAFSAAFLVFLVGFGAVMTVQSARLARQRNVAEREAAKATAVTEFLQTTIGSANPAEGIGRDVTVLEALESATRDIDRAFADQPEIAAAVKHTVGSTYLRLGRYDEAEPLLESALEIRRTLFGPDDPSALETLTSLGGVLLFRGDYDAAEEAFREVLEKRRAQLGEHPEVAASLNNLGLALNYRGRYEEAEPLYREALALRRKLLGDEHAAVAETMNNLAFLLHDQGDYEGAEELYRSVVALDRKLLGPEHPDLATDLDNFASLLDDKGDYAAAEPLFREALEIRRQALGSDHPDVAKSMNNLATLYENKGDLDTAESLFREAIAHRRRLSDQESPELATNLGNLGRVLFLQQRYPEALAQLVEAQRIYGETVGEDHWLAASSRAVLGRCLARLGRCEEGKRELTFALETLESSLGEDHERTRTVRGYLDEAACS